MAIEPSWSGYRWEQLDGAVRSASAHGLKIVLTASAAPPWAEGADRPSTVRQGTWKPSPIAYGEFGEALARRYSGRFPDPGVPGAMLPRVRFFEAWNEPNLSFFLTPQWHGHQLFGAAWYRNMLSHFYTGVKSVEPDDKVIAPAAAPYGSRPGDLQSHTPPVQFIRSLFCMKVGHLRNLGCPARVHFDIFSVHPINLLGGPNDHAESPLDASTPDVGRLARILRKAEQIGQAQPRLHRPIWATEIWWNTNPPLPYGVPPAKQARWVELSQYVLWRQGVSAMINLQMVDRPLDAPGELSSGIFLSDGSHKPSYTAFRFPLVARREGGGILVWGIAPGRGVVHLQKETAAGWHTIASVRSQGAPHPFVMKLPISNGRRIVLRAQQGSNISLPWTQDLPASSR